MINKIKIFFGVLLVYLLGYRAYTVYAKWKTFDNKIIAWDTVLLKKDTDIHSGIAMAEAIDQSMFFDIFKDNYTFDHLEPSTIWDYLETRLILC